MNLYYKLSLFITFLVIILFYTATSDVIAWLGVGIISFIAIAIVIDMFSKKNNPKKSNKYTEWALSIKTMMQSNPNLIWLCNMTDSYALYFYDKSTFELLSDSGFYQVMIVKYFTLNPKTASCSSEWFALDIKNYRFALLKKEKTCKQWKNYNTKQWAISLFDKIAQEINSPQCINIELEKSKKNNTKIISRIVYTEKQIRAIGWREFEEFVKKIFLKNGYDTILTPERYDEGKDVIAKKNNKTYFIECKH